MRKKLFSLKVRASLKGKHLSGAERIVEERELLSVVEELCRRVKRKNPDNITIKYTPVKEEDILYIEETLQIEDTVYTSLEEARKRAVDILHKETGIKMSRLEELLKIIDTGAAPDGSNMRGAMIVNENGERIEKDRFRGVRTTSVDFIEREKTLKILKSKGYTDRTLDALALTTKNLHYPDMIAEYCISDESNYITGYVSTKERYYRITPLKEKGKEKGGRIYFVKNSIDIEDFYNYLQNRPVLIKKVKGLS